MPFTKIGNNTYQSPSGRKYNEKQVRLWYANGGKFPGEAGPGELSRPGQKEMGPDTVKYSAHPPIELKRPKLLIGRKRYG